MFTVEYGGDAVLRCRALVDGAVLLGPGSPGADLILGRSFLGSVGFNFVTTVDPGKHTVKVQGYNNTSSRCLIEERSLVLLYRN